MEEGLRDQGLGPKEWKGEDLSARCRTFALKVIRMLRKLQGSYIERELGRQVLRSSASIGANWEEAIGAHTKADFSHSANIAKKEARETRYWLRLIQDIDEKEKVEPLVQEAHELMKIFTAIVKKSQK